MPGFSHKKTKSNEFETDAKRAIRKNSSKSDRQGGDKMVRFSEVKLDMMDED